MFQVVVFWIATPYSDTQLYLHLRGEVKYSEDGGSIVLRNTDVLPHHYTCQTQKTTNRIFIAMETSNPASDRKTPFVEGRLVWKWLLDLRCEVADWTKLLQDMILQRAWTLMNLLTRKAENWLSNYQLFEKDPELWSQSVG